MIIAWFFMVSNQLINSDSNYKFMKSMIEGILSADQDTKFIVFLPHSPQKKYKNDGWFSKYKDYVETVVYPTASQKTFQAVTFNPSLIFKVFREYGVNIVFNNIQEVSAQFSQPFNTRCQIDPLLITYNHYTIHKTLPYPREAYTSLQLLGLLGNYVSHLSLFNTQYHFSMMRDNLQEHDLMQWLPKIKDKTAFLPIPVLDSEMMPFYNETEPFKINDKNIVFYYNHRLQEYKKWKTTFNLLNDLWNHNHKNFTVNLSYNSGDNTTYAQTNYPFIKLNKTHTHREYYQKLCEPHFNTINTVHETFCISIVESALLGGIPIIPKTVTFPELFPQNYQFFFNDTQEQKQLITNVLDGAYTKENLTETKIKLRKHFSKYNSYDIGKQFIKIVKPEFNRLCERAKEILKQKHKQKLHELLQQYNHKPININKLWRTYKQITGLGQQAMPAMRFTMILETFPHEKHFHKQNLIYTSHLN